jgi:hypothetical protein
MAKLVALSALLGAAVALQGRPVHACEKDRCHQRITHVDTDDIDDDDDDDRDSDDQDDDDDDDDRGGGPGFHIHIVGPIRGTHVEARTPPEPPEPPPPPEPPRWRHRAPRAEAAFPEAPPAPSFELSAQSHSDGGPTSIIGVGLRASTVHVGRSGDNTASGGVLYVPLTSGRVTPFLVVGTGMNFSFFNKTGDELHEGYLSGGGGLAFACSRRFSLELDARFMLRQFFDDTAVVARQGIGGDEPARDQAVEVRMAGIFYF